MISVWRNNADALVMLPAQLWEHFLTDNIDLALVHMTTGVAPGSCAVHSQYVRFILILCHDNKLSTIEFLVAEASHACAFYIEKRCDFRIFAEVWSVR